MKRKPKTLSPKCLTKIENLKVSSAQKNTLKRLFADTVTYMEDSRFSDTKFMADIMAQEIRVLPGESLSTEQEQIAFLQFNYARYQLCLIRRKLLRMTRWSAKTVQSLLEWNTKQLACRSKIVSANIGLVLSMAQRVKYPGVEFNDLISEGSMALLRATEKFDCSRGFKFSTYACRAILKAFSRTAKRSYRQRQMFCNQQEYNLDTDDHLDQKREQIRADLAEEVQTIMKNNAADLTKTENMVVRWRFSLDNGQAKPLTLKQVGVRLGLTKERIRQIQNNALAKLRNVIHDRQAMA